MTTWRLTYQPPHPFPYTQQLVEADDADETTTAYVFTVRRRGGDREVLRVPQCCVADVERASELAEGYRATPVQRPAPGAGLRPALSPDGRPRR